MARRAEFSWTSKVNASQLKQAAVELVDSRVDDTMIYNDVNGDSLISVKELFEATEQWNVLNYKHLKLKQLDPADEKATATAIELEKSFHQKYSCGNGSLPEHCLGDDYFQKQAQNVKHLSQVQAYQEIGEAEREQGEGAAGGEEEEEDEADESDGAESGGRHDDL